MYLFSNRKWQQGLLKFPETGRWIQAPEQRAGCVFHQGQDNGRFRPTECYFSFGIAASSVISVSDTKQHFCASCHIYSKSSSSCKRFHGKPALPCIQWPREVAVNTHLVKQIWQCRWLGTGRRQTEMVRNRNPQVPLPWMRICENNIFGLWNVSPLRNLGPLSEFMALFVFPILFLCNCFFLCRGVLLLPAGAEFPVGITFLSHVLLHSLSLPFFFLFRFLLSLLTHLVHFSRHPVYFSSYLFLICVIWPFLSALLGVYTKPFLYLHLLFLLPSTVPHVHQWNPRTGNGNRHPQAHRSWYNKQN